MWSKLPASRWCLTTVCSVTELYSLWTHIWKKNPIWASHTLSPLLRPGEQINIYLLRGRGNEGENMLILQARHHVLNRISKSCCCYPIRTSADCCYIKFYIIQRLRPLSNRYKELFWSWFICSLTCLCATTKKSTDVWTKLAFCVDWKEYFRQKWVRLFPPLRLNVFIS